LVPTDPVVLTDRSIAVVLGTRPEIIKLAHIIRLLGPAGRVVHTGQHYDARLSGVFFRAFGLDDPAVQLEIGGRSRGAQIGNAVTALDAHFEGDRPAVVVVQGDTNTTLAAALAANSREISVVHVEAGLRSHDRAMPEEHNRVVTDHLADVLLAPTDGARSNLLAEGIPDERIVVTGNTVIEAVKSLLPTVEQRTELLHRFGLSPGGFVLSTFHRPENVDRPETFATILHELAGLGVPVVLPLHPRSRARAEQHGLTDLLGKLMVVDPIGYQDFLGLLAECAVAVADSGGVQEEVSVLKRPVVVVRNSTERPEVIGTFAERVAPGRGIGRIVARWLADLPAVHEELSQIPSPYGDGRASERTLSEIRRLVGST
jgi:UDP-N-acetylglucosamine 2-epimerase (non-hydrolysing)